MYDLRILKLFYNVTHSNGPSYFSKYNDALNNDTCKNYNAVIRPRTYYNH